MLYSDSDYKRAKPRKAQPKSLDAAIFGETTADYFIAPRFDASKEKHNFSQVMNLISFEIGSHIRWR